MNFKWKKLGIVFNPAENRKDLFQMKMASMLVIPLMST